MKKDLLELLDEIGHIVGTGRRNWFLIDLAVTGIGGVFSLFVDVVENYVWHSFIMFVVISVLTVADFVTGVWIAAKKNKVETRKFKRLLYTLGSFWGIMGITFWIAKGEPDMYGWLPYPITFVMVNIQLLSVIKNLSLLGLIPTKVANALWERIDAYKNPEPPTNSKQDGN